MILGAALRTAANDLAFAAAKAAFEAELARVTAENARVAQMHAAEVQDKIMKEQQHKHVRSVMLMHVACCCGAYVNSNYLWILNTQTHHLTVVLPLQAMERWERTRGELAEKYKADIARAKREHMENVTRAEKQWQIRCEEV